jgi:flotillin
MGGWAVPFMAALGAVIIFSFLILLSKRYKRCPSNAVLVIYGKVGGGISSRCIHGGAAFVWPLIQAHNYLSLEPMQIEIPLEGALSMENIRVNVPSVFTVAIGTELEVMNNAAIRLLNLGNEEIKGQAKDIIFGQLRQVIASMKIEDINRDREAFLRSIQDSLEPELRKVGLVLINVNITDITDASGYIEAIGKKAASQAIQQARGDVAEQEKLGEVRVAEAERDKQVQVAEAHRTREIGIRQAQREQAVRVSELDKEQAVGIAGFTKEQAVSIANLAREQQVGEQSAEFEKESQVKDAERQMRINVAQANAKAIEGENTSKAQIAAANAGLMVREAEAYQVGETRKRQAEAAVLEVQNLAMAKAAIAQAERVEQERRAQLEAPAKAEKARVIVDAEAEAEKRRIEAQGEASAIFAKLDAEARGQYEILAKKGEGLSRIVQGCGGADKAFQLLMLEHLDTLAHTSAQAISNIKFDKVIVWENGGADGHGATSGFLQSMARTLPPMMQVMKEVGGVEFPEYLARFANAADKKAEPDASETLGQEKKTSA